MTLFDRLPDGELIRFEDFAKIFAVSADGK